MVGAERRGWGRPWGAGPRAEGEGAAAGPRLGGALQASAAWGLVAWRRIRRSSKGLALEAAWQGVRPRRASAGRGS